MIPQTKCIKKLQRSICFIYAELVPDYSPSCSLPFLILIVRSKAVGNGGMSPIPKRCHDLGFGPGEREGTEEGGVEVDEAAPPAAKI